ncbi:MAG: hypothetical protein D3908_06375 [Candidatus Electrothrix sp. AUS4]|nr:hypothetical protein [Candidatus Electrothrix sp. AUS4]
MQERKAPGGGKIRDLRLLLCPGKGLWYILGVKKRGQGQRKSDQTSIFFGPVFLCVIFRHNSFCTGKSLKGEGKFLPRKQDIQDAVLIMTK